MSLWGLSMDGIQVIGFLIVSIVSMVAFHILSQRRTPKKPKHAKSVSRAGAKPGDIDADAGADESQSTYDVADDGDDPDLHTLADDDLPFVVVDSVHGDGPESRIGAAVAFNDQVSRHGCHGSCERRVRETPRPHSHRHPPTHTRMHAFILADALSLTYPSPNPYPPNPRPHLQSGHMLVVGGATATGLAGGVDLYSVEERRWSHFPCDGSGTSSQDAPAPPDVMYASLVLLNNVLTRFGGIDAQANVRDSGDVDLHCFDFSDLAWVPVVTEPCASSGERPCARFNATLTAVGLDSAVLVGGQGGDDCILGDVWKLSLRDPAASADTNADVAFEWTQLSRGTASTATTHGSRREGHATAVVGHRLYVLGGSAPSGDIYNDEAVDIFDLDSCTWTSQEVQGEGPVSTIVGGSVHSVPGSNTLVVLSANTEGIFNSIYLLHVGASASEPCQWLRTQVGWGGDWSMIPGMRLHATAALDTYSGLLYVHHHCPYCRSYCCHPLL